MDLDCVHTSAANGVFGGEQTIIFPFDDCIALACPCLQSGAIEYGNMAAAVMDQSCLLQVSSGFRNAFAAHTEHICNQLLCHRHVIAWQAIQAQ